MKKQLLLIFIGILLSNKFYSQTVPVVDFSLSALAVCPGATVNITDLSTGSPTTWTYTVDGAITYTTQNIAVSFTNSGTHYIDLISENASGQGTVVTKTFFVNPLPIVSTGTIGSVTYTIPPGGSTNGWSPLVLSYTDILPSNAVVSGVDLIFSAVDQGWGGTGAGAGIVIAGTSIGYGILQHSSQTFTINYTGAIPAYLPGASNTFEMYFVGWPGWEAFWEGGVMTVHYQTNIEPATYCSSATVTLSAIGASTYTWSHNISNNVAFTATSSAIYTVSGTSTAGCVNTMTQEIIVAPLPTVSASSGTICAGNSFTINPSGASSYTVAGGSLTVTPSVSSTFSIAGTNSLGCVSPTSNVFVTVIPIPTVSISGGSICAGTVFTFMPSGADAYILGGTTTNTVSPSATTSYSFTGLNLPNCKSPAATVITVSVIASPTVTAIGSVNEICSGENAILTAAGATNYSWNTGSTTYTTSVHPLTTKSYTVTGSDVTSCSSKAVVTVTVNQCTGVSAYKNEKLNFYVFPNPGTGRFILSAGMNVSYSVINGLGQEIIKTRFVKNEAEEINLEGFENGIYFVRVSDQGKNQTLKIVKQN